MLMLAPGDYVLTSKATSSDAQAPDGLSWDVICMPKYKPLVSAPLSLFLAASGGTVRFSVPAEGCATQTVQLTGAPADVTRNQSARIERVAVERATP